jgi:cytochrome c oxidase assembly protein subunit 15
MPTLRRLVTAGLLLCLAVVVLGAYVRLTAAGLGCPDWPGCYGHPSPIGAQSLAAQAAFPDRPLNVGKAWHEMIHRYAAATLGLIIVVITSLAIAWPPGRVIGRGYGVLLLATVLFQAVLGMLTVTWQLKPLIVTLHLLFGLTTLSLLWWLWLSLPRDWSAAVPAQSAELRSGSAAALRIAKRLTLIALAVLVIQILLGGWTSSNYAAVACPDFPTCQNAWLPPADFKNAFVLWRGLGVNYEGGVLENPARVAIHFTHRIGAIIATVALLAAALFVIIRGGSERARLGAYAVLTALVLQLTIGITMVREAFPLPLATAHNAGAALLLLATLALLRGTSPARAEPHLLP